MSLSQFLSQQASDLAATSPEFVAIEMLKQAGLSEKDARMQVAQYSLEKSAVEHLVASGIETEKALGLVKAAGVQVADLEAFEPEQSVEERISGILVKAAEQAKELEDQLADALEKLAQSGVETPEYIQKLASTGSFTNADLEALMKLPAETLTKVASAQEEPWSMGKGTGMNKSASDPFTEFLLS